MLVIHWYYKMNGETVLKDPFPGEKEICIKYGNSINSKSMANEKCQPGC